MLDFSLPIEFNRRALISDLKRRLERALNPFHLALDNFLARLFRDMLPADWRDRWRSFVAEQAAAGFTIAEESASQMEAWIEAWAKDCGLLAAMPQVTVHTAMPVKASAPKRREVTGEPRSVPNVPARGVRPNEHIQFFRQQMDRADGYYAEIKSVLEEVGKQLDAAPIDEEVNVDDAATTIEDLIWKWNDAREAAREAWLRNDLHRELLDRFDTPKTPRSLGVPYCLDDDQYRRAQSQFSRIGDRLRGENRRMDRIILDMQSIEAAGLIAGVVLTGGVILAVYKKAGTWAAIKIAVAIGGAIVADQYLEKGLRLAGVPDEVIGGAKLAALVVSIAIFRRRNAVLPPDVRKSKRAERATIPEGSSTSVPPALPRERSGARTKSSIPRTKTTYVPGRYNRAASQPGAYWRSGQRVFPTKRNSGLSGRALREEQERFFLDGLRQGKSPAVLRGQAVEAGYVRHGGINEVGGADRLADRGAENSL